eukprot:TRINITY_DN121_c1_g1_i3.p2 TRINITY_DN121_c1_g1~~TRINITY_DN121_c1_g1_i3.p2  ORF type:complete len:129 (-),score=30.80 TRINITY_DN121_c1_g1_i3:254-640(-)
MTTRTRTAPRTPLLRAWPVCAAPWPAAQRLSHSRSEHCRTCCCEQRRLKHFTGNALSSTHTPSPPLRAQPAQLYHPWRDGVMVLDEFGVGLSLYFKQLLLVALILAACVVSGAGAALRCEPLRRKDAM